MYCVVGRATGGEAAALNCNLEAANFLPNTFIMTIGAMYTPLGFQLRIPTSDVTKKLLN